MRSFDYIIIGAGSAGCVLANRLSASGNHQVLVLEAGGKVKDPLVNIPGAYGRLFKKKYDWGFWTEEQKHVNGRKIYLPRGKILGGCSSTNAMAHVRGNRLDYDLWADQGNKGWGFKDVLPYFIKSENNRQFSKLNKEHHGQDGELIVTYNEKFQTPFSTAFIDACQEYGIPFNEDSNGSSQDGVGRFQFNIRNGERHSGFEAFLKPAMIRPNVEVITNARVSRLLVKDSHVSGVEFYKNNNKLQVAVAKYEVILSAGSYQSPQILMLSGIGDPQQLEEHRIPCNHALFGVGKNLQDHLFFPVGCKATRQLGLNHVLKPWNTALEFARYFLQKRGPLSISPLEAVAFTSVDSDRVNLQFHFSPMHIGTGYDYDLYDLSTYPTTDGFTLLPTLLKPKSRGEVRLRSNDPFDAPEVQPNFLSEKEDLDLLVKGAKIALEILDQPSMKPFVDLIESPPGFDSEAEIADHIRKSVETVYHPVGTCKMGNGKEAVVNDQLQVHGLSGLRVIDASIMPEIVSGNTNAPVYMIAEKGADMILSE